MKRVDNYGFSSEVEEVGCNPVTEGVTEKECVRDGDKGGSR